MTHWNDISYQRIKNVEILNDNLIVTFENGDVVEVTQRSLIPFQTSDIKWTELKFNPFEVTIPARPEVIEIPWDKIRVVTDKKFAKHAAEQSEEQSKLIGVKIKKLRERKNIKSLELAERAGVTPQTITRIEKGHTDVSFVTLRKLLAAMGYNLKDLANQEVLTDTTQTVKSYQQLLKKFTDIGIDTSLVDKILPSEIKNRLSNFKDHLPDLVQNEISTYFSKIFGWDDENIWGSENLIVKEDPAQLAYFKTPKKGNIAQIRAYSHYAYYLANAICKISSIETKLEYPEGLDEFKKNFYEHYQTLSLENLLNFTWDFGISVIPLNDQGIFHGASWNINDKHVIVLKQRSNSHARWIFDLLHELYHVFVHLEKPNTSVVETEELNPFANNDSSEELEANSFANQFLFGHRSEELAMKALEKAGFKLELLKKAVNETANIEKINADILANYLAFRLQMNGENWWGTANSFQITTPQPFVLASKILKERIPIQSLNPIDKNLISSAIK